MAMAGYTPAASGDDKVWMMFIISSGVSKRQRVSRTFRSWAESCRSLQFTQSFPRKTGRKKWKRSFEFKIPKMGSFRKLMEID
jgi:hypothetical protein